MGEVVAFLPGVAPTQPAHPLGRYLPPIPEGIAAAWLTERIPLTGWVAEPFGASPTLPVEIARAGYRVLATVNNPITRFLIERLANPPQKEDLRAALAELATMQRAGERIEPHIRTLYQTECARCGKIVEAQAFIWERGASKPVGRIYTCLGCKDSGERPANEADIQRATSFSASGLHRARALERVASLGEPERTHVEEALSIYLPRAVYALFTLINRLDGISSAHKPLVEALLLAAFDQANVLWPYPAARSRPRQLNIPPRFLEKNIWFSLENAVTAWSSSQIGGATQEVNGELSRNQEIHLPITLWPETPPQSGGICLFEGRFKDMIAQFQSASAMQIKIRAVATAFPRPNQAFWTLSALWAGWLWGRNVSSLFKSVLRRRRYDWSWHSVALQSTLSSLSPVLETGTTCFGLLSEAEASFVSAAITAAELSNLELVSAAIRVDLDQAQLTWKRVSDKPRQLEPDPDFQNRVSEKIENYLKQCGEPAHYLKVHTCALSALTSQESLLNDPQGSASDALRQVEHTLEGVLLQTNRFLRYAGSSRSMEVGLWWLNESALTQADLNSPLADRLEIALVRYLQAYPVSQLHKVDQALCIEFPGLFTPDLDIIQKCLESYAEQLPEESGAWKLRSAEAAHNRRADLAEMQMLLMYLGKKLGYKLQRAGLKKQVNAREPITWYSKDGELKYVFYLIASGVLGQIIFQQPESLNLPAGQRSFIVLPGGRAGWVEYKLRRDPRLRAAVEANWRLIKFRHVRWLAENENLSQENLEELLAVDPLTNRDLQMPLL